MPFQTVTNTKSINKSDAQKGVVPPKQTLSDNIPNSQSPQSSVDAVTGKIQDQSLPIHIEIPVIKNTSITAPVQTLNQDQIRNSEFQVDSNQPNNDIETQALQPKVSQKTYTLEDIINEAVSISASDIHINEGYRVFARKHKKLIMLRSQIISKQLMNNYLNEISRFDSFGRNLLNELHHKEDFDLAIQLYGQRFRVNIVRTATSYSISMRLIPEKIKNLDELGLPNTLENLINYPNGLVLVTGATGSGKSTTLAALVNLVNQKTAKKIITLEDPVEYVYPKSNSIIVQRSLGIDFFDWESGIKSVLRQDPNIVVIGEVRDGNTLDATLKVAETGHLVFATLHTNSAASTIQRLIDMFGDGQKSYAKAAIASSLRAVITQELLYSQTTSNVLPALEVLFVNNAVQNLIKEQQIDQINNTIATSSSEGMVLMDSYKKALSSKGLI